MMFEKILNEYAKNVRHIDEKMLPVDQMRLIVEKKIDYAWLSGEKVRVSKDDATLIESMCEGKTKEERKAISEMIDTGEKLRRFVKRERDRVEETASRKKQVLDESVSAMFEMMRNLKYLPGLEKVTSVNNTVDGMEATVQALDGTSYHFAVRPVSQAVTEDFWDRSWFKSYKEWDEARRSVPTDDDDQTTSRYEGKTVAKWERDTDEGWIRDDKALDESWGSPIHRSRRLKTGSINTPLIGRRIVMRRTGEEGVVTGVEREPTFSQMVPYILMYGIKLDSGERDYVRREEFKVRKEQPVAEGMPEGPLDDFLDPFKRRAVNTGTPPSRADLIDYHKKALANLGLDAPKTHITYHEKELRKLQSSVKEDTHLARKTDGDKKGAITAMRRAAITMIHVGVGRNEQRVILELQTIGLNYGLKPMDAVDLAKKIFASEMGARRRSFAETDEKIPPNR